MPNEIRRIVFEASETHLSDQFFGPGRLTLLAAPKKDGPMSFEIERSRERATFDLTAGDRDAIAEAIGELGQPAGRMKTLFASRNLVTDAGVCLRMSNDNRGDPYSSGILFHFEPVDADGMADYASPRIYLDYLDMRAFLAALSGSRPGTRP